jgi:hypothetical protein
MHAAFRNQDNPYGITVCKSKAGSAFRANRPAICKQNSCLKGKKNQAQKKPAGGPVKFYLINTIKLSFQRHYRQPECDHNIRKQ